MTFILQILILVYNSSHYYVCSVKVSYCTVLNFFQFLKIKYDIISLTTNAHVPHGKETMLSVL